MNQKQLKRLKRQLKQAGTTEVVKVPAKQPNGPYLLAPTQEQVAQGDTKRTVKIAKKIHAKVKENLVKQSNVSLNKRDKIMGGLLPSIRSTAVAANDRHHQHNQKKTPDMVANSMIDPKAS